MIQNQNLLQNLLQNLILNQILKKKFDGWNPIQNQILKQILIQHPIQNLIYILKSELDYNHQNLLSHLLLQPKWDCMFFGCFRLGRRISSS